MRLKYQSQIAVMLLAMIFTTATAGAWPHRQELKAHVHFLATSTFLRSTFGQNEDTYLAELRFPKQNEAVLVRMVDTYPNYGLPLSRAVVTSSIGAVLLVKRDEECDRPFGEILLRTAPGDPMATLPERLAYRPHLDQTPAPEAILPCYRVLRR
jgi:hypothetical protein